MPQGLPSINQRLDKTDYTDYEWDELTNRAQRINIRDGIPGQGEFNIEDAAGHDDEDSGS